MNALLISDILSTIPSFHLLILRLCLKAVDFFSQINFLLVWILFLVSKVVSCHINILALKNKQIVQ